MQQPTIIGVLGKPLSGKDTVAKSLCEKDPGIAMISMGEVLREVKKEGPSHRFWDMLHESSEVAADGGLAYDYPVFQCLTEIVAEKFRQGKTIILWVGGPKSEYQLGLLDSWAHERGMNEKFLFIDVPDTEVYHRLDGRRDGREDDEMEKLRLRLKLYDESIKPVVDKVRTEGRLAEVYGVGDKDAIRRRVVEALRVSHRDPEITLPAMARR